MKLTKDKKDSNIKVEAEVIKEEKISPVKVVKLSKKEEELLSLFPSTFEIGLKELFKYIKNK